MSRSRFTRSFLLLTALGVLAVGCSGGGGEPSPSPTPSTAPSAAQVTDADNGSTVQLARGGTLTVSLESNASTGFAWSVAEPGPAQLELQGEPVYVAPDSDLVGAAGTQVFTFAATTAGTGALTLDYTRSFEEAVPPEQTFTLTVEVE